MQVRSYSYFWVVLFRIRFVFFVWGCGCGWGVVFGVPRGERSIRRTSEHAVYIDHGPKSSIFFTYSLIQF